MKEQAQSLYVLGQKIMLVQTPKDFDMAYVVTPAGMPGPPPHYHDKQTVIGLPPGVPRDLRPSFLSWELLWMLKTRLKDLLQKIFCSAYPL